MPSFGRTNEQKKQHKERAQPFNRQRYGLLEKKKDYVLRATDYKQKQQRLKTLRNKASQKNEDEFYFGMIGQKTKNGIATKSRGNEALGQDLTKLLKTQDAAYIKTIAAIERSKLENLRVERHLPSPEGANAAGEGARMHAVFVDTAQELTSFEPHATAITSTDKRPDMSPAARLQRKKIKSARAAHDREFAAREARLVKLRILEKEVEVHRNLQGKGSRKIVGKDSDGTPRYKWKQERKR